MNRAHSMPFGAAIQPDGSTRFRLWAPSAKQVELLLYPATGEPAVRDLARQEAGWYELVVRSAPAGTRYAFRINAGVTVPDPASRFNPADVHGPSEVVDPGRFDWRDVDWRGRPFAEAVIYELHVGTFTREGTFNAIEPRLRALARLGITAIELMPIADFPGSRGWGYDGVLPFAPESRYGRPEDLKHLVQVAHQCGLMVFLDVVYNHFGPDGNYLGAYADRFFTHRHRTPWGEAINLDGPDAATVRDFFVHNALYWLEEFHFDGLRVDAVHAFRDDSSFHLVEALTAAIETGPGKKREVHLMLENHDNDVRFLRTPPAGTRQVTVSQWNDDFHHALHVILTGEHDGYYADFAQNPVAQLGRCLAEGFAFQGGLSAHGGNVPRGEPSGHLRPTAFVNFLQTHDQVGNRAFGDRLSQLTGLQQLDAGLAILLLSPSPPLLFMGEEFAAVQPFLYFCDFTGELAANVTAGRRREFSRFAPFADPVARARIPDPCDPATFASSRLRWSDQRREPHRGCLRHVRELLRVRHHEVVPLVALLVPGAPRFNVTGAHLLTVTWPMEDGSRLVLQANLGPAPSPGEPCPGRALFDSSAGQAKPASGQILPWSVRLTHAQEAAA